MDSGFPSISLNRNPSKMKADLKTNGFLQVVYDADALSRGNIDSIADDVIQMFSSEVNFP